jgi:hypothetical protein
MKGGWQLVLTRVLAAKWDQSEQNKRRQCQGMNKVKERQTEQRDQDIDGYETLFFPCFFLFQSISGGYLSKAKKKIGNANFFEELHVVSV